MDTLVTPVKERMVGAVRSIALLPAIRLLCAAIVEVLTLASFELAALLGALIYLDAHGLAAHSGATNARESSLVDTVAKLYE